MSDLSPKQYAAIAALASGSTIQVAANCAEVCEKTLDKWLKKPFFRDELLRTIEN